MDTRPYALTPEEWREVVAMQEVRDAWGLEADEKPEEFSSRVYAAKFRFHSGGPGYVGDLYILQGDALTDPLPMTLIRDDAGKMVIV